MVDITVQIMAVEPTHNAPHTYKNGDVIQLLNTQDSATLVGNEYHWDLPIAVGRLAFIHVRNAPAGTGAKMQEVLTESDFSGDTMVARRFWRVSNLPQGHRDNILANRETTMSWTAFKDACRLISNDRPLEDGDVS